jgi:hypothetical protein
MSKKTLPNGKRFLKYTPKDSTSVEVYEVNETEMLEIHLYYKARVIKMERDQNTPPMESAILDSCEFQKHKNWKFNQRNFLKNMAKRCNYKYDKLYSGLQKRRIQRRWAKVDFFKSRGISIK